jgi:hypothetical protein
VEGTGAETTIGGKNNFVANNMVRLIFTRLEPSASGGSLVVVMINTTVTL